MKNKKGIMISAGIIAGLILIGILGVRAYAKQLYNSRSCDWGNIDNIELHTRTDIPEIIDVNCSYDEILNSKKVVFSLDPTHFKMSDYIKKGRFVKVGTDDTLPISDIRSFEKDAAVFKNRNNLYYKKGDSYSMLLDSVSGKLWIYLAYAT